MKRLCIITPSLGKYSETFIQNQIDYLPFEKFVVTTGTGEFADKNGIPLASPSFYAKTKRILNRKIKKRIIGFNKLSYWRSFFSKI